MTLNFDKALQAFDRADMVELDCGTFDLRIRPASAQNEKFKAAAAKLRLKAAKKSVVAEQGLVTGSYEQDIELLIEAIVEGWGTRPLTDDEGNVIEYSPDVFRALCNRGKPGRVFFDKISAASLNDNLFAIPEGALKNS